MVCSTCSTAPALLSALAEPVVVLSVMSVKLSRGISAVGRPPPCFRWASSFFSLAVMTRRVAAWAGLPSVFLLLLLTLFS